MKEADAVIFPFYCILRSLDQFKVLGRQFSISPLRYLPLIIMDSVAFSPIFQGDVYFESRSFQRTVDGNIMKGPRIHIFGKELSVFLRPKALIFAQKV